ncbi:T9SS type A sorting domain-containing protein [Fluviicola sp.]|uniref:T9SS type A sorting domain-containing protein n=1 Tax=Fluviicola sp. TaxID=1917219 RepID=UPI003D2D5277
MRSQLNILFLSLLFNHTQLFAQCASAPAAQTCAIGCTTLTNNANVNSGQTYCYTGTGSLSGINMNGGTIIVCGSLTITSMNFNAGTFYINSGSTLNFNTGGVNMGNATIVNYGTVTATGNVTMQPVTFYNATAASTFTVSGQLTLNNSSLLVNNGSFSAGTLLIQTSSIPALCLGIGSQNSLGSLFNNSNNSISAPSGNACIYVSTQTYLNATSLSTSTTLQLCQAATSTIGGPGGVGAATVYLNCTICSASLPVELLNFDAQLIKRKTELTWETETEKNSAYFSVQRSQNGQDFTEIGQQTAAGNSTTLLNYKFTDKDTYYGVSYYRLKQVDTDGAYMLSSIRSVYNAPLELIGIFPNPVEDDLNLIINSPRNMDIQLLLYDNLGRLVKSEIIPVKTGYYSVSMDISTLDQAIYRLKIITEVANEQLESIFIKK